MIKGDKEYLDQIVKTHLCPKHGPKLVVAWSAEENCFRIRCGEGHFPDEVTREKTPIEEHKAGEREAHSAITSLLPKVDLVTGEILPMEVIQGLIAYAEKYSLDPYRGHVVLMYGKPYITIDGYLYHANREKIAYRLESRPLKDLERGNYQIAEGDHAWVSTIVMVDGGSTFTGTGIVTQEEMTEKSKKKPDQLRSPVVAAHPWQLAQKRAEWQALRRAFPIGETEEVKDEAGD